MTKDISKKKVMVALSGGVDSTVAAMLLIKQGYEVYGVVFALSDMHEAAVEQARKSASQLGIPLFIKREYDRFDRSVVQPFCSEYMSGRTPNPCVICNPTVKFGLLLEASVEHGCDFIATGHYAHIVKHGERYTISRAHVKKDQSYMLYRLTQEQLSKLLLPLCEYQKPEVRALAKEAGYDCADLPDSQDICFVENGGHTQFVENRCGNSKSGYFISPTGERLTAHKGISNYTVGQRKGIGIALGKPVFIKEICENGDIKLSFSGDEYSSEIVVSDIALMALDSLPSNFDCEVKIRFASTPSPARIISDESQVVKIIFDTPQRAPAPGQSAVFYNGDMLIGGGIINKVNY